MTKIVVVAWDRVGLLSDITGIVSSEGVNISAVRSSHRKQGTVTELLTLQTSGAAQLSRILSKAEEVKGVISVNRTG
jgi:GTP pyrophosphokinase